MKLNVVKETRLAVDVESTAALIAFTQRPDGDIPWSVGDKTDPWDLIESAMGLNIAGHNAQARLAFSWLAERQLADGAWYASYRDGEPEDRTRDSNMTSYLAVGLFHDYLITGDAEYLEEMWPVMAGGVEYALSLQAPGGEIHWAASPEGVVDQMALLTGSSSVFMSLKCALAAARVLGRRRPDWEEGRCRLGEALRYRPHSFNMAKNRYSMDWFYPVLCGALTGADAHRRLDRSWDKYVVKGQGVLCVSDQPWVTVAETSELVLALAALGSYPLARHVFGWIQGPYL